MRRKRTAFNFSGPYSEIRPAKLTNHNARTKRYNKCIYKQHKKTTANIKTEKFKSYIEN